MAILLHMPEVTANATQATLQAWTRNEGDTVAVGDCIAEIETDKAVVELNADSAGVLGRCLIAAGQSVDVGAPIGVLLINGETHIDVDALIAAAGGAAQAPGANAAAQASISWSGDSDTAASAVAAQSTQSARTFASPLARRLAGEHGLELTRLAGSGPKGRIVKRDVEAAAAALASGKAAASSATRQATQSAPVAGTFVEVPHSNMRSTIARRLSESKSTIPHFYLTANCRMERLLALRAEINADAPRRISVNDFIVRAVAVALREVPAANVGWTDTAMRQYTQADIAVAVSTDSGLITPIVRAADRKPLSVISAEIADLATRARAGRLRPDEYQGGSFGISNLGMFGATEFSAIINPPQAAILAIGAIQSVPVAQDGEIRVGQVMRCTLSVDHRAIDGALAAQWLAAFTRLLENPLTMLI